MFWVRGLLGICINYLCKINGVLPFPWHAGRGNVRQMGLWFTVGIRGSILGAVSRCRGADWDGCEWAILSVEIGDFCNRVWLRAGAVSRGW